MEGNYKKWLNRINSKQDVLTEDNVGQFMDLELTTKSTPTSGDTVLGRDSVTGKAVEIPTSSLGGGGSGLTLGETSSTAYRGDRGKIAYDHSQTNGNAHDTELEQLSDVSGDATTIIDTDVILKKETGGHWKKLSWSNIKATLNTDSDLRYITIEANSSTGTEISFTNDRIYGSLSSPETGNISCNITNAKIGVTNIIIHNSGTVPTFGSQFKKLSGSGSYVVGVVNYIYCTFITATEIIYSINQRS